MALPSRRTRPGSAASACRSSSSSTSTCSPRLPDAAARFDTPTACHRPASPPAVYSAMSGDSPARALLPLPASAPLPAPLSGVFSYKPSMRIRAGSTSRALARSSTTLLWKMRARARDPAVPRQQARRERLAVRRVPVLAACGNEAAGCCCLLPGYEQAGGCACAARRARQGEGRHRGGCLRRESSSPRPRLLPLRPRPRLPPPSPSRP